MPRDRIIQVQYENGLPVVENDTLDRYAQTQLFQTEGFIFYHSTTPVGDSGDSTVSPLHTITITLSDAGHLEYTNDGENIRQGRAQHSDTFLWLADRPIYASWEKPLEFLSLSWDADFLARSVRESVDSDRIELIGQALIRDPLVYSIGLTLWKTAQIHGGIDKIYGETLASTLAVHTLRNYAARPLTLRPLASALSKTEMRRAVTYIHDNLDQPLSLQDIAAVAGYSVHHFKRLFKAASGKAVHQYVIEQRVEKAKTLLLRGDLSIGEVSALVGFYDQSHLHKYCKRLLGVTPKDLKKRR